MQPKDDLSALLIDDPTEAHWPPEQPLPQQRLRRLSTAFVRIKVSWFTTDSRAGGLHSRERLLLLLLHLSRWDQRPVTLTTAMAKQVGINTRQEKLRLLSELEEFGWIRVTRDGRKTLVVCPIVDDTPAARPA